MTIKANVILMKDGKNADRGEVEFVSLPRVGDIVEINGPDSRYFGPVLKVVHESYIGRPPRAAIYVDRNSSDRQDV